MHYYALLYHTVEDFLARRTVYRDEHLRLVQEAHRRGDLLLAGALTEPADGALLVFRTANRAHGRGFRPQGSLRPQRPGDPLAGSLLGRGHRQRPRRRTVPRRVA